MYKLKSNLTLPKEFKINVNRQTSECLQKYLFQFGWKWRSGSTSIENLESKFLYVYSSKEIFQSADNNERYFKKQHLPQIRFEDYFEFVFPEKWCIKVDNDNVVLLNDYLHQNWKKYSQYTGSWNVSFDHAEEDLYFHSESDWIHSWFSAKQGFELINNDQLFNKFVKVNDSAKVWCIKITQSNIEVLNKWLHQNWKNYEHYSDNWLITRGEIGKYFHSTGVYEHGGCIGIKNLSSEISTSQFFQMYPNFKPINWNLDAEYYLENKSTFETQKITIDEAKKLSELIDKEMSFHNNKWINEVREEINNVIAHKFNSDVCKKINGGGIKSVSTFFIKEGKLYIDKTHTFEESDKNPCSWANKYSAEDIKEKLRSDNKPRPIGYWKDRVKKLRDLNFKVTRSKYEMEKNHKIEVDALKKEIANLRTFKEIIKQNIERIEKVHPVKTKTGI